MQPPYIAGDVLAITLILSRKQKFDAAREEFNDDAAATQILREEQV